MLEQLLAADPGYRGPRVPCGQGHQAGFVSYRDKVIDTVLGAVTLTRAWYHCAACGHGFAPRDARLGVAGASISPGLRAMNDQAAATAPFAKAARLLEVPGRGAADGQARRTSSRGQRHRGGCQPSGTGPRSITARKLVPLPPSPLPDKLYAAIDGTGVPVTAKETAGRDGKREDGRARTREVKLAVFFTQDKVDDDGYPVRDRDSSSYIATFEPAAVFAGLVKAEGIRRGADHVRQLTILGDGAAWIWNIASSKFPEATQIVDLFHAREHLHDLARLLEFMLGDHKDQWLAARLDDLDHGDIDGICRAARVYPLDRRQERRAGHGARLLREQRAPHALHMVPLPRPVRRLRSRRSRAASPSSASASSSQACTGPSPAQMPSPRCAASRPAAPKTRSGTHHATRHQPPDQPNQLNDPDHLRR